MKSARRSLRLVSPPPHGLVWDAEAAFRQYGRYVATIAYRILGRDDDLEDLVQEVFLQSHRELHRLRDPGALQAWLGTTTVRAARRALRARRLRELLFSPFGRGTPEAAGLVGSPEERAIAATVYRVLDRLPADDRIAWTLRVIEGEPLDRVALLAGCSLATAKRRIARAQRVMSALLAPEPTPGGRP